MEGALSPLSNPKQTPGAFTTLGGRDLCAMKTRVADEATYVLAVLYHMRDQVAANPNMFGPDALKFIGEAIARTEMVVQNLKVACSA